LSADASNDPNTDLEDERELDALLSRARPAAPPIGLRDRVMARLQERRVLWEWLVAVLFAVPSLVYLVRLVIVHGEDFIAAIGNVMTAASSQTSDAFFFVDGLTVLALALFGIACAVAAHALFVSETRRSGMAR
jgi:hypothetical protein